MIQFRPTRIRPLASRLAPALCVIAMGCGSSGPQMGRVSGTVTHQGKPVTKGSVTFVSTVPERPNANGPIGPDGTYALQTTEPGDGAHVGDYLVSISGKAPEELNNPLPGAPVKVKSDLPAKYEKPGTSTLKATVSPGSNTVNFDLKD
jgi:hypothetical protein